MQYLVVGPDGKEYGPASVDTLKQWAGENRLMPNTQLRDFNTGQIVLASSLTEVFPPIVDVTTAPAVAQWPQAPPPANYAHPGSTQFVDADTGMGDIWGAIIRSVLAIVFFFVFHGIGIIFAGYGLYYAFQAQGKGHRYGWVAIVISSVTLVAIGIGWLLRLNGVWV
jgi:hypothetical protein